VKEPFGQGRRAEHADGDATRGFAENRHAFRVASERGDVPLDPLETRDHVEHAVVAGDPARRLGAQFRMRIEPEEAHAIGDADEHDSSSGQLLAAVCRDRGRASVEATAIDPDEHRDAILPRLRRSPDVQIQAVFVHAAGWRTAHGLHASGCEPVGRPHPLPFGRRLRRAPSKISDRRRRERDPLVHGQGVFNDALHQSAFDLDRLRPSDRRP